MGEQALGRGRPQGNGWASLLLAKAATAEQLTSVGKQSGGRVFLFLHTSDFWEDYRHMQSRGVRFAEEPRQELYGMVVMFFDLYGNKWDLVQPNGVAGYDPYVYNYPR